MARCHTTKPADRCARRQSVDSQLQAQATGETHVGHFRPSWKRKPFLIFVFRIWLRRMFIWSQWCAWSSGFRRKVATAPSFLVAKPRVPGAKCDYAPRFFEPCLDLYMGGTIDGWACQRKSTVCQLRHLFWECSADGPFCNLDVLTEQAVPNDIFQRWVLKILLCTIFVNSQVYNLEE